MFQVTFPGLWSNTCCSHPLATEDESPTQDAIGPKRAALRKLNHELGIPAEECPVEEMVFVSRILYAAACAANPGEATPRWGEHELDYILFLRCRSPSGPSVSANANEVSATRLLARRDLASFVAEERVTPWFDLIAREMLPRWWDALLQGDIERERVGSIVDFT